MSSEVFIFYTPFEGIQVVSVPSSLLAPIEQQRLVTHPAQDTLQIIGVPLFVLFAQ